MVLEKQHGSRHALEVLQERVVVAMEVSFEITLSFC